MIYLMVEHTNDDDCDLLKFQSLTDCVHYVNVEEITGFDISDKTHPCFNSLLNNFQDDDYTLIKSKD